LSKAPRGTVRRTTAVPGGRNGAAIQHPLQKGLIRIAASSTLRLERLCGNAGSDVVEPWDGRARADVARPGLLSIAAMYLSWPALMRGH